MGDEVNNMKKITLILFIFPLVLFGLTACGGGTLEGGFSPPGIPIRISLNSNGEINIGVSNSVVTPYGTFDLGYGGSINNLRSQYTSRVLIIQVDARASIYELEEGKEFHVKFDDSNKLYRRVALNYESDGDIVLELESAQLSSATLGDGGNGSQDNTSINNISSSPIFESITQRENNSDGQLIINEDIYFSDTDGDAYLIQYELVSVSPDLSGVHVQNDSIEASPEQQKNGASKTITWKCGSTNKTYTVTLQAQIVDQAGNQSAPFNVIFKCH